MNKIYKALNSGRAIFFMMVFLCSILAIAVLKLAASVILPFTIAALLAFIMYPLVKVLDKLRWPRFLSIFFVVIIIVAGLFVFGIVLFSSGRMIIAQYPQYEERFNVIFEWAVQFFELSIDKDLTFWENLWGQTVIRTLLMDSVISLSNNFLNFLSNAVLVVLFLVFFLAEASYIKEKLEIAFENRSDRISRMGHDLMSQVTRYLSAKFLFSLANGIIYAVSFYFIGLEFAIVWGVFQFLMNFIPTLGSIVAGVIISLFALIQFWPEPGPVIIIVSIILGVNLILSNFLDPKLVGEHVGISPLMVLVSLSLWGYIWGFAGMVLAVPMTVIIKIVCENIPVLEPVSILIGSRKSVRAKKAEQEKNETVSE